MPVRFGAAVVLLEHNNELGLLLVQRDTDGLWGVPTGHVEISTSNPTDAATAAAMSCGIIPLGNQEPDYKKTFDRCVVEYFVYPQWQYRQNMLIFKHICWLGIAEEVTHLRITVHTKEILNWLIENKQHIYPST